MHRQLIDLVTVPYDLKLFTVLIVSDWMEIRMCLYIQQTQESVQVALLSRPQSLR